MHENIFALCNLSIHAPREGGDPRPCFLATGEKSLSIHAPREGGDRNGNKLFIAQSIFQSTPPVRGATVAWGRTGELCGLSIHAPREGGDLAGLD